MAYIYVMSGRFSKDAASATRVLSFCRILDKLEKEVIVISLDDSEPYQINLHNGIKYLSLRSLSTSFVSRVLNLLFFKKRLKKQVKLLSHSYKIEGIFFYDIPINAILFLKK